MGFLNGQLEAVFISGLVTGALSAVFLLLSTASRRRRMKSPPFPAGTRITVSMTWTKALLILTATVTLFLGLWKIGGMPPGYQGDYLDLFDDAVAGSGLLSAFGVMICVRRKWVEAPPSQDVQQLTLAAALAPRESSGGTSSPSRETTEKDKWTQ